MSEEEKKQVEEFYKIFSIMPDWAKLELLGKMIEYLRKRGKD